VVPLAAAPAWRKKALRCPASREASYAAVHPGVGRVTTRARTAMAKLGIQDEYALIAQGMRNGTLKEPPAEKPPELWISKRFSSSKGESYNGFCEQFDSRAESSKSYSFGLCTLADSLRVSVPKDMSNGMTDDSPGPQMYNIKGTFGKSSAQFSESTARRGPNTQFGTDLRHSADVRELKSRGVPVDQELEHLRLHSLVNTFKSGHKTHRIDT